MSEFVPLPKQYVAMTCPAREIFYAGAAGPGKSDLFIQLGKRRALISPGSRHVYFRRVSKDLDAHLGKARHYIPSLRGDDDAIAGYGGDKTVKRFTFKHNQSEFLFTHLAQEAHVEGHRGAEYDTIFFDEASLFTQEQLNFLQSRLRSTIPETHEKLGGPKFYLASNPTGVSHYYLLKNYIQPDPSYVKDVLMYYPIDDAMLLWEQAKEGLQVDYRHKADIAEASKRWIQLVREHGVDWSYYDDETRRTKKEIDPFDVWTAYPNETMLEFGIEETHPRCFIPAYLEDNPYLGPDYAQQLAQLYGDLAPALLKGDWTVFQGQFFSDWAEKRRDPQTGEWVEWHVIPPMTPPEWWPKMAAMDWGFSEKAMTVIGFYAFDPDREEWIKWDEIAVNQKTDAQIVQMYKSRAAGMQIDLVACDPAIFGKRDFEVGMSQGQFYQNNGVPLSPADNSRVPGWQMLRSVLAVNPRTGRPKLRVCSNCRYTIETLPGLVHNEKRPEDLNTEGADHAADEMRYFAVKAANRGYENYRPADEPVGVGVWNSSVVSEPKGEVLPSFLIGDEEDPWDRYG